MTLHEFTQEFIQYWVKAGENPKIIGSIASSLKFVSEKHYELIMQVMKKTYSPSKTVGVFEINKTLEQEGIKFNHVHEVKFMAECECCGNTFLYHQGTTDVCGRCRFPYEYTTMVIGYRMNETNQTVPKSIVDGYERLMNKCRSDYKRSLQNNSQTSLQENN
jgi:hypothetical protein